MTEPHKDPCPVCHGQGTVPHDRRRMANGDLDLSDFRRLDVCTKCGGGGKAPSNLKAIEEKPPGFIADSI
jgi:DnaJ-class molecular chaperone